MLSKKYYIRMMGIATITVSCARPICFLLSPVNLPPPSLISASPYPCGPFRTPTVRRSLVVSLGDIMAGAGEAGKEKEREADLAKREATGNRSCVT